MSSSQIGAQGQEAEVAPPPVPEGLRRVADSNFLSAKAAREGTPPKAVGDDQDGSGDLVKVHGETTSATVHSGGPLEDAPKPKLKKRIIRRIVRKKKVLPKKDEKFCSYGCPNEILQ
nr:uncharacterized protein LOC115257001 [Aedes albopictus]